MTRQQIQHKGKTYGYSTDDAGNLVQVEKDGLGVGIRSESNRSGRTPYLSVGSKLHSEVLSAILESMKKEVL
jgi:hypothetical protein